MARFSVRATVCNHCHSRGVISLGRDLRRTKGPFHRGSLFMLNNHLERLEPRQLFAIYGLDPTFGVGGRIGVEIQSATTPSDVSFVHTLPDGKVLAGGLSRIGAARVHRFDITGQPDTTFSGDGISDTVPMVFV